MRHRAVIALCIVASALVFVQGQSGGGQNQPPAADPAREVMAPDIPGVVAGGTKVQFVAAGFKGTEAVVGMSDGSVLFTEYEANKILKIDEAGKISTFVEDTQRAVGLGYDPQGRLIAVQQFGARVSVLYPTRTVLADSFEGQPLTRTNDLVVDSKGGIYFTDPIPGPPRPVGMREPPAGRVPLVLYIKPDGNVMRVTDYATSPNGIQLSPDEKTLYVADGPRIVAFDVEPGGGVKNPRTFVDSGGDGLAVDNTGRLYAATADGVRVISPQGRVLGTIPTPLGLQSVGFAGRDKKTMYAVGRGAVYKISMLAEGIRSRAK